MNLLKKEFFVFLTSLINASSYTKYVSLSNQKCDIEPTLINLNPNEYSHELHYHSFAVELDKCVGSCGTSNDLSNKVCIPNKEKYLNIHLFNVITGKNEL